MFKFTAVFYFITWRLFMVQKTIEQIEEKIRINKSLSDKNKSELLELLANLKPEINKLSKDQSEHAESIAGFVERSAHEATRQEKNPTLLKIAGEGLSESVKGFESSHPELVETVNYIANALANIGL
jgi:ribosome-binding ATPase YchF (GTP1/OBG family)